MAPKKTLKDEGKVRSMMAEAYKLTGGKITLALDETGHHFIAAAHYSRDAAYRYAVQKIVQKVSETPTETPDIVRETEEILSKPAVWMRAATPKEALTMLIDAIPRIDFVGPDFPNAQKKAKTAA